MALTEISGKFYKTGGVFSGFRARSYRLVWQDYKLFYGTGDPTKLSGKHFDLRKVTKVALALDRDQIKYQKNALSLRGKKIAVAGVILIDFPGIFTKDKRQISAPSLDDFHTLAYWIITSVEKHSKFRFSADNKDLDALDVPKDKLHGNRNARAAILFNRIAKEFYSKANYDDKNKFADHNETRAVVQDAYSVQSELRTKLGPLGKNFKLETLGKGGCGSVYKGTTSTSDRPVAVKHVLVEKGTDLCQIGGAELAMDGECLKALLQRPSASWESAFREATALYLVHEGGVRPNIMQLYDVIQVEKGFCFFFELCDMKSSDWALTHLKPLGNEKDKDGKISKSGQVRLLKVAGPILDGILDGFARMHDLGMVHLDVKNDNVLISVDKEKGHVAKVIDLGLAKGEVLGNDMSELPDKNLKGTPTYRAPEEFDAKLLDKGDGKIAKADKFRIWEKVDSYKVGLFILRLLSRVWFSEEDYDLVVIGDLLQKDGKRLKALIRDNDGDLYSADMDVFNDLGKILENEIGWAAVVKGLGDGPLATLCTNVLNLMATAQKDRGTVRDLRDWRKKNKV